MIVQQEGRHMNLGKADKSPAAVLPAKICSLDNDTFAESR